MTSISISSEIGAIAAAFERSSTVVVEAPPGAGKTTRLPLYLYERKVVPGEVVVLEPRRLAARLAAEYVAQLANEEVGGTIGYQVRHESVTSSRTRLRFVTDGLFLRQFLSNPTLSGISLVVLDEFHERRQAGDLILALLSRLQATRRPDIKLLLMSATLDTASVADKLDRPAVFRLHGRSHPLTIHHLTLPDQRPLAAQVASTLRSCCATSCSGDVLVFLPGAAEIRQAASACAVTASLHSALVLPLHGDLPRDAQNRALRPATQRKIILATNVAETSITIDGVTTVIDSGLARIPSHNAWSGLGSLLVKPISRASATQRAGRAGRTAPGEVWRLYTEHDFATRPAHDTPEILRSDLSELALILAALDLRIQDLNWIDTPPQSAVDAAETLLRRLGACDVAGHLSPLGAQLVRFPVHPRQARLLCEAAALGLGHRGALLAALQSERDVRQHRCPARESAPSDLLAIADDIDALAHHDYAVSTAEERNLHASTARAVMRTAQQLEQLARGVTWAAHQPPTEMATASDDDKLRWALLCAYPDRVAQRSANKHDELLLAGGGRARLAPASVVQHDAWMVAVDAELDSRSAQHRLPLVRLASSIEPDWLLALASSEVKETDIVLWNATLKRVEAKNRLVYGALILAETAQATPPADEAEDLLQRHALAAGISAFADPVAIASLIARVAFLQTLGLSAQDTTIDVQLVTRTLRELCHQRTSFAELRDADLLATVRRRLTQPDLLQRAAPEHLQLPSGRKLTVHYELGKPPWVESYLQDFFGMGESPRLGCGRATLTIHLWAPNRRPLQITTDLAGFWQRHYQTLRPALARRYPKHAWPDDPLHAQPREHKPRRHQPR